MSINMAKQAIPLCSATNAVVRLRNPKPYFSVTTMTLVPSPVRIVRLYSLCNSIPTSLPLPSHFHILMGKIAAAHESSESDPPEIPSVPAYEPSFPPELPGPNSTPFEQEQVGPEIVPDPVPKKPPLAPPGGPDFPFPVPPTPSPPGPDIPLPPPPDIVPPPPPPEVVPPKPPEIVPPLPNMPPDIIPPPTGPFAAAGSGAIS